MKNKLAGILATVVVIFAAASFVVAQNPQLVKRTTTKTDKFDFGSGGTLVVTGAPNGSIKIVGTTKNEIEITAVIGIQGSNEADLAKLSEVTGFVTDETVSRTGILTVGAFNKFGLKKLPKNFPKKLLETPYRVDYVINVPHFCDLEIDGGKGDLSVTNVEGSMRISFIETIGRVEVIGGNTSVTVGSGNLEVAFGVHGWRGRSATISVATGNLNITLPSNLSADIDAVILKTGAIDNKLIDLKPRDRKVPFTDKSVLAKAGVGGVPLKFAVGDGTLKMDRLVTPL